MSHVTLQDLTPRRRAVAELVGDVLTYRQIGATLGISPNTARSAVNEVARRLPEDGRDAYHRVMKWVLDQKEAA